MKGKLIRYYGGKWNMKKLLVNELPEREIYIEAFGGSATLLFEQKTNVEIYNDININVYSLFKILSDKVLFQEFKKKLNENITILERAYYFFYINRTSYNGVGGFTTNHSIRRKMAKCVSDYLSAVDGLEEFHQRLSNVIVRKNDAIKIINEYNSNNVFFYLDPPYHHSTRSSARYENDFTNNEHKLLIETILNSKSKIMLSGYENELYTELENNGWKKKLFTIHTVDENRNPKTKVEAIWVNY